MRIYDKRSAGGGEDKHGKEMEAMRKALRGAKFVGGMNVRRDRWMPEVWRGVAVGEVVRNDGWMPWRKVVMSGAPGKVCVWFRKGHSIGYGIVEAGEAVDIGMAVTVGATLKGEPTDVTDIKGGWMRISVKGNRAVYAVYTSAGVVFVLGEMPELPWLHFERYDEATVSIGVGTIGLSGESAAQGSMLSGGDQEAVSVAVKKAYSRLRSRINGAGRFMQPVVARYRLLDGNGSTVVSSPPVLIGSSAGLQDCGDIALTSSDGLASLSTGSMNGKGFRLKLCGLGAIAAPWRRLISRVVVELSGEIDPVDSDGVCSARVSNDGHVCTVTAWLPVGGESQHRMKVAGALMRVGDYDEYLVVEDPFGEAAEAEAGIPVCPSAVRISSKGEGIGAHPLRDGVSYGGITAVGDRYVAWDETRELWRGFPPECFAIATVDGSWRALSEVKMNVGGDESMKFTSASSGDGSAPVEFSPLLVYPDTYARELTISLSVNGTVVSESFPLTPLPEAGCSFYLADSLKGIMPREVIEKMPVQQLATIRKAERPGLVGVFADVCCSRKIDEMEFGSGRIARVSAAPRNNGSWDFSRSRVIVFGGGGIHVATLDGGGRIHSSAPLDRREIVGREGVFSGSSAKGLSYFAIAGGDVVQVDRGGVVTLLRGVNGEKAGWCGRYNEIWLWDEAGGLRRINPDRPDEVITCGGEVSVSEMSEWGGRLLIGLSDGAVYDVTSGMVDDEGCDIGFAVRFPNPEKMGGVRTIDLPLRAAHFCGTVGIYGDNGSELPELLSSYSVNGAINGRLPLRIAAPRREFLELHIAGRGRQLTISN